jgi:hypothetical protein
MKAIAEEANMWGLRVAAHAHGASGIRDAALAGIDTIEHASLIDDEGIAAAKKMGAFLSMDIYNTDYTQSEGAKNGVMEDNLRKDREIAEVQRQGFRKAPQGRREDGLRHRRWRLSARRQRETVRRHDALWRNAPAGDPDRHDQRRRRARLEGQGRRHQSPAPSAISSASWAIRWKNIRLLETPVFVMKGGEAAPASSPTRPHAASRPNSTPSSSASRISTTPRSARNII